MDYVTLKVDRVLDLKRGQNSKGGKFSIFGFEMAGKEYRGLKVWDWPPIYSGMTITPALQRPNDVHSLKGWYDHQTGQVVSPSPVGLHWLGAGLWLLLVGLVWFEVTIGERSNAPWVVHAVVGAALAMGAICCHVLHGKHKKLQYELEREGARQRFAARGH